MTAAIRVPPAWNLQTGGSKDRDTVTILFVMPSGGRFLGQDCRLTVTVINMAKSCVPCHRPILLKPCSQLNARFPGFRGSIDSRPSIPRLPGLASGQWSAIVLSPPPSTPASSDISTSNPVFSPELLKAGGRVLCAYSSPLCLCQPWARTRFDRYCRGDFSLEDCPTTGTTPQEANPHLWSLLWPADNLAAM